MKELARSFIDAMTENPRATLFCLASTVSLLLWSTYTFASKEDMAKDIGEIRVQVQQMSLAVGDISTEIRRSSLQAQRRDLNRQIDEIRRMQQDGLATERELLTLPRLLSDLEDVQDELRSLPLSSTGYPIP